MNVVDLAPLLEELGEAPPDKVVETALGEVGATRRALLWVPRGARWSAAGAAGVEHVALVLEGRATWRTGEERQTLASGHLVVAAPGVELGVENDGDDLGVIALLTTTSAGENAAAARAEGPA